MVYSAQVWAAVSGTGGHPTLRPTEPEDAGMWWFRILTAAIVHGTCTRLHCSIKGQGLGSSVEPDLPPAVASADPGRPLA